MIDHKKDQLTLRSIRPTIIQRLAEKNIHPEVMRLRTGHSSIGAMNTYTRFKNQEAGAKVSKIIAELPPLDEPNPRKVCCFLATLVLILHVVLAIVLFIVKFLQ